MRVRHTWQEEEPRPHPRQQGLQFHGVEPDGRWWFQDGPVHFRVRVAIEDGELRLRGLDISAPDVTAAVLRGRYLGPIRQRITEELSRNPALFDLDAVTRGMVRWKGEEWYSPELVARLDAAEREAFRKVKTLSRRRGGRRPASEAEWALRAAAFLDWCAREPRRPAEAMAQKWVVATVTVHGWLKHLRREGWLDGRKPGARLIEWLANQGESEQ